MVKFSARNPIWLSLTTTTPTTMSTAKHCGEDYIFGFANIIYAQVGRPLDCGSPLSVAVRIYPRKVESKNVRYSRYLED